MVVHDTVAMGLVVLGRHGRLKISPLGVLPLALVGVLVTAQRLRGGEVAAAIVTLELAGDLRRRSAATGDIAGRVLGGSLILYDVGFVGELDAEEADAAGGSGAAGALSPTGGSGANEGELGEGVDAHEVPRLSLAHLSWSPSKPRPLPPRLLVLFFFYRERERVNKRKPVVDKDSRAKLSFSPFYLSYICNTP